MNNKSKLRKVAVTIGSSILTAVLVLGVLLVYNNVESAVYYYGNIMNDAGSSYAPSMSNGITAGFGAVDTVPNVSESVSPDYSDGMSSDVDLTVDRKLIKRANITVETTEFDEYMGWLESHVASLGGYFESKETSSYTDSYDGVRTRRILNAKVRVPSSSLVSFLDDIQSEGNVTRRSENQDDITTAYTDADAHLESIRIEQARLNELLSQAETVDEILAIEDRLSYVRYEIESYERQLRTYNSQIDYSVVSITLEEVLEYTQEEPEGFFARCLAALQDNLVGLGYAIQNTAIFLFAHILEIAIGSICGVCFYKWRKRCKKNKAESDEN